MAEYTVKAGDSLSKVFGDKWKDVAKYNKMDNPDKLSIGQKIRVPDSMSPSIAKAPKPMSVPQSSLQSAPQPKAPVAGLRLPQAKSPAQIAIDNARKAVDASKVAQFKAADQGSMNKLRSDANANRREIGAAASSLQSSPVKSSNLPAPKPFVPKLGDPRLNTPFQPPRYNPLAPVGSGSPFSPTTYRSTTAGIDTARAAIDAAARLKQAGTLTKNGQAVRNVGQGTGAYVGSINQSAELSLKDRFKLSLTEAIKRGPYNKMFDIAKRKGIYSGDKAEAAKKDLQQAGKDYQAIVDKK